MSNEYRNQHHHPSFFLKGFADTRGRVWIHQPSGKVYDRGYTQVCCQPDFYSYIDPLTGVLDPRMETGVNRVVDNDFGRILHHRVFRRRTPSADEKEKLARALAYQCFRTPANREAIMDRYGGLTQRAAVAKFMEEHPQAKSVASLDLFDDTPQDDQFRRWFANIKSLSLAMRYTQSFLAKEWEYLQTTADAPFITSDKAFALVNRANHRAQRVNMLDRETVVIMPLNKRFTVIMQHGVPLIPPFRMASAQEVRVINMRVAQQCLEFVIASTRSIEYPPQWGGSRNEIS